MARRRALAAGAVLLAVTACGGQEAEQPAAAPEQSASAPAAPDAGEPAGGAEATLLDAVDATQAAGSARTALSVEGGAGGQAVDLAAEGVVDFADGAARLVFDLPQELGGGTLEQLTVGGSTWFRSSRGGEQYVAVPAEQLGAGAGSPIGGDPTAAFDLVRGATDVREAGPDEVRGAATTRYEGTVDVEAAVERAPEAQREQVRAALEQLGAGALGVTAQVDEEGRLRQVTQRVDLSAAGGQEGAALTTTVDWFDFGVETGLQAPGPDQVRPGGLESLFGAPGAGAPGGSGG